MMDHLSKNLRLLCAQRGSIARVCREIDINRQQFNRYLSGENRPSAQILLKIADFFEIPVEDLDLKSDVFSRRLHQEPSRHAIPFGFGSAQHAPALTRYCGWYHTYFRSANYQGGIIKGFARITQDEGITRSKVLDRYYWRERRQVKKAPITYYKMNGVVTLNGGFLYILDQHKGRNESYTMTCLYPSYGEHVSLLNGLMIGVSSYLDRRPFASNIAYVAVEKGISLQDAVRQCGVYDEASGTIPKDVKHIVRNRISKDLGILAAQGM